MTPSQSQLLSQSPPPNPHRVEPSRTDEPSQTGASRTSEEPRHTGDADDGSSSPSEEGRLNDSWPYEDYLNYVIKQGTKYQCVGGGASEFDVVQAKARGSRNCSLRPAGIGALLVLFFVVVALPLHTIPYLRASVIPAPARARTRGAECRIGEAQNPGPGLEASDLEHIRDHITGEQFRIQRMPADGNCLFHCMAHALGWEDYRAVKTDLLRFFPTFQQRYDPDNNLTGDYADYLRHALRTDGEWGDYEHSHIFARRHNYTVIIHRPDDNRVLVGDGPRCAHFYWRNQSHYDLLMPLLAAPAPPQPVFAAKRKRARQPTESQDKKLRTLASPKPKPQAKRPRAQDYAARPKRLVNLQAPRKKQN